MYNINNLLCRLLLLSTFATALTDVTQKPTQILAEGGVIPQSSGDKSHLGREHVINTLNNTLTSVKNLNTTEPVNETTIKASNNKSKDNGKAKPVIEKQLEIDAGVSKKNDEKQSVGKKGVSFSDTDSAEYIPLKDTTPAMKSATTAAPVIVKPKSPATKVPVPKKPRITEHDETVSKDPDLKKPDPDPKISNIDTLLEKKSKRANYVIPIVAVILSVPLVAIIISFLYKRGTDWWQHRNYRRMDFLIEGMYNN